MWYNMPTLGGNFMVIDSSDVHRYMEEKFELEVLTRLAVIESKIDDYKLIKEKSNEAYNLANRNLETINKIEDRNKWLWRTSIGALITGLIGILILFIKLGLGIN